MHRWIIAAFFLLGCTACATHYGNYARISDEDNMRMVDDTVRKLASLYPPASTKFQIDQPINDTYGSALIQKLRTSGYGMEESKSLGDVIEAAFTAPAPKPTSAATQPIMIEINEIDNEKIIKKLPKKAKKSGKVAVSDRKKAVTSTMPVVTSSRVLGYIVDQISDGMYRVTLNIDGQSLSSIYVLYDNRLVSAGSWTRKE